MTTAIRNNTVREHAIITHDEDSGHAINTKIMRDNQTLAEYNGSNIQCIQRLIDNKIFSLICLN